MVVILEVEVVVRVVVLGVAILALGVVVVVAHKYRVIIKSNLIILIKIYSFKSFTKIMCNFLIFGLLII